MKTDLQTALQKIRYTIHKGLHATFQPSKKEWIRIYDLLQQGEEIEVHDAEVYVSEVRIKEETYQAVIIEQDCVADFVIAIPKEEGNIFVYSIKHELQYDEMREEYEGSVMEHILKQTNFDSYRPLYVIQDHLEEEPKEILYQPIYKRLYTFHCILESILSDINEECEEDELTLCLDEGVTLYRLEKNVSKQFKAICKEQRKQIISFYHLLKEKETIFHYEDTTCEIRKIKVKNIGSLVEEKEDDYRDAIVIAKNGTEQVLVFHRIEDNEYREVQDIHLYHCEPNHMYHINIENLFEKYTDYKRNSMSKIQYKEVKKKNENDRGRDELEREIMRADLEIGEIYFHEELQSFFRQLEILLYALSK